MGYESDCARLGAVTNCGRPPSGSESTRGGCEAPFPIVDPGIGGAGARPRLCARGDRRRPSRPGRRRPPTRGGPRSRMRPTSPRGSHSSAPACWPGRSSGRGDSRCWRSLPGVVWFAPDWDGWERGRRSSPRSLGATLDAALRRAAVSPRGRPAPTGRLESSFRRGAVVGGYVLTAAVSIGRALLRDPFLDLYCWRNCSDNALLVDAEPGIRARVRRRRLRSALAIGLAGRPRRAAAVTRSRVGRVATPRARPRASWRRRRGRHALALLLSPLEDPACAGFMAVFLARAASRHPARGRASRGLSSARTGRGRASRGSRPSSAPRRRPASSRGARRRARRPRLDVLYWLPGLAAVRGRDGLPLDAATGAGRAVDRVSAGGRPLASSSTTPPRFPGRRARAPPRPRRAAGDRERGAARRGARPARQLRDSRARIVATGATSGGAWSATSTTAPNSACWPCPRPAPGPDRRAGTRRLVERLDTAAPRLTARSTSCASSRTASTRRPDRGRPGGGAPDARRHGAALGRARRRDRPSPPAARRGGRLRDRRRGDRRRRAGRPRRRQRRVVRERPSRDHRFRRRRAAQRPLVHLADRVGALGGALDVGPTTLRAEIPARSRRRRRHAHARGHRAPARGGRRRGRRPRPRTPRACSGVRRTRPDAAIVDIRMPPTTPTRASSPRSRSARSTPRSPCSSSRSTSSRATRCGCSRAPRARRLPAQGARLRHRRPRRRAAPARRGRDRRRPDDRRRACSAAPPRGPARRADRARARGARARRRGPVEPRDRGRLVVTQRTVEAHVKQIFLKLGLDLSPDSHRRVLAVLTYLRAAT